MLDVDASTNAVREARRFRLPLDGPVKHVGVYTPSLLVNPGGPHKIMSARPI